jgi:Zn-dependent peptidase ImmA (M78 family)
VLLEVQFGQGQNESRGTARAFAENGQRLKGGLKVKAKLFRKLRVFGKIIPVFRISGLMDQGAYGYYSEEHEEVGVDADLKGEELEHTVIHELFHAVLDRLHCQQQMSPEFVEVVVENLSRSVIDNFKVSFRK